MAESLKMLASQRAFAAHSATRPATASRVSTVSVFARESRVGSRPIPVPKGVTITQDGQTLKVKGPLGTLEHTFTPYVILTQKDGVLKVEKAEDTRLGMSQHGLSRTLASNMVVGTSSGFSKVMELVGTGYRASVAGKELTLNVGYSKPRVLTVPEGLKVTVEKNTTLTIFGYDKVKIGDFAALVRRQRAPEPYKGKGIRFQGEVIKLKEGKAGGGKKK